MARYFQDQEIGDRVVLYTESEGVLVGYITIFQARPFSGREPELFDFNVFEAFQNKGIGNTLLEEAESQVKLSRNKITLGVDCIRLMARSND